MNTSLDKRRAALRAIGGRHSLTDETIARIDSIDSDKAHRNAMEDPDAQPSTLEQLDAAKSPGKRAQSSGSADEVLPRLIGK